MPWWNWLLPWKWADLWRGPVSDPEPAQTASPIATSKAAWLADTSAGSSEAAVAQTVSTESSDTETSTSTEDQQTSQELQELQDQIAALQETVEELEEEVEEASGSSSTFFTGSEGSAASTNNPLRYNNGIDSNFEEDDGIERGKANEGLSYSFADYDGISRAELEDAFLGFMVKNTLWADGYSIDLTPSEGTANGEPIGWDVHLEAVNWWYMNLGRWDLGIEITDALGNEETLPFKFSVFPEGTGDEGYFRIDPVDRSIGRGQADELIYDVSSNMGIDVSVFRASMEALFGSWEYFPNGASVTISDTQTIFPFTDDTFASFTVTVEGQVASADAVDSGSKVAVGEIEYNFEDYMAGYSTNLNVDVI